MTQHLRTFHPHPKVLAFYDGRIPGQRFAPAANWVDDGALSLGIASYALVDGDEALVFDTHISPEYGAFIRKALTAIGVTKFTVVLSHWHLDHVAGTAAFADCRIVANRKTAAHLQDHRADIERGTASGPPAITPLILPTDTYEGRAQLHVGALHVDLMEANIHSDDATVLWLAQPRLLLAGDTLEDTITYVDEPGHFETHLTDLDRLWALDPHRILPNHGSPDVIKTGGYEKTLIRATQQYIRVLRRCLTEPQLRDKPLRELIKGPLEAGWVTWFEPYAAIHRHNVDRAMASAG